MRNLAVHSFPHIFILTRRPDGYSLALASARTAYPLFRVSAQSSSPSLRLTQSRFSLRSRSSRLFLPQLSPPRPRSPNSSVSRSSNFGSLGLPPPISADESPPPYSEHDPYGTRWRRFRVRIRIRSRRATVLALEVWIGIKHIVLALGEYCCLSFCLKSTLRLPKRRIV